MGTACRGRTRAERTGCHAAPQSQPFTLRRHLLPNTGRYIMAYVNRRDIADDIRAIPDLEVPTNENLASFDEYMMGPPL